MCIELRNFRVKTFSHVMAQILDLVGLRSIWEVDLQRAGTVRVLAIDGKLDRLSYLIESAKVHATKAGLAEAASCLKAKQAELTALTAELRRHQVPAVDVEVLDADDAQILADDWGRKGRGAKIRAWIACHLEATSADVASRYQLAASTAKRYLQQARKQALATTPARKPSKRRSSRGTAMAA